MTGERWQEIRTVLEAAMEMNSERQRAYLDQGCSADQSLRGIDAHSSTGLASGCARTHGRETAEAPEVLHIQGEDVADAMHVHGRHQACVVHQNAPAPCVVRQCVSTRLKFTPDGRLVLVSDLDGGELIVLDAHLRKEIKRIKVGNMPEGILITPDASKAYVAVWGDGEVAVVELNNMTVIGRIRTGSGPDGMAWAERK
jgi:YVTN family beta-propeller protein